jgi:hypothetical protein
VKILYAYLKEVLSRFNYSLGGGSLLIIAAGIVEHFTANSVTWPIYTWLLVACFVIALITHGARQYERLLPRIVIRNVTRTVWPFEQFGHTGAGYHFDIFNSSASESLENVRAEIVAIEPSLQYLPLPVPMKIKHDDYDTREFSINPLSIRQIDLLTGPVNNPRSHQPMVIVHTVKDALTPVPDQKYRITVRISAKNTPPVTAVFETWIENRELMCVHL